MEFFCGEWYRFYRVSGKCTRTCTLSVNSARIAPYFILSNVGIRKLDQCLESIGAVGLSTYRKAGSVQVIKELVSRPIPTCYMQL